MAERDIVGGMFGMTPEMYQQGMARRDTATNAKIAGLTPGQLAGFYAMEAGTGLGRAAQGLLGVEDPQMQLISRTNQLVQEIGIDTPEKLRTLASELQKIPGGAQLANQAVQRAADLEQTIATTGLRQAQAAKASTAPSVSPEQLLTSGRYTPASVAKYQASGNIADLVLSKEATGGADGVGAGPGPVGKAGAYRDAFGQIYGGSEMKAVRQEFDTNEKLLTMLNKVTEDDVKKAESIIDWTTKEGVVKGAGAKLASDTVTAQTKIAASQLLKQIESLPPGSASNADMVAAMKDFPGYGSQAALAAWINRAKETIQTNLGRQVEQFGFRQRVQSTPALNMAQKPEKSATKEKAPKVIKLD
jgi:hypothetical protein